VCSEVRKYIGGGLGVLGNQRAHYEIYNGNSVVIAYRERTLFQTESCASGVKRAFAGRIEGSSIDIDGGDAALAHGYAHVVVARSVIEIIVGDAEEAVVLVGGQVAGFGIETGHTAGSVEGFFEDEQR